MRRLFLAVLLCGCSVTKQPYREHSAELATRLDSVVAAAQAAAKPTGHSVDLKVKPRAGDVKVARANTAVMSAQQLRSMDHELLEPKYYGASAGTHCLLEASSVTRTGRWPSGGGHKSRANSQRCTDYVLGLRYVLVLHEASAAAFVGAEKSEGKIRAALVDLEQNQAVSTFDVQVYSNAREALERAFVAAVPGATFEG